MSLKNAKAKGSRNERRSRDLLIAQGFRVTKAGGSLGEWDLVAVGAEGMVLVQVKSNRWPGRDEMARLKSSPAPFNAKKLVHRWRDYAREPDVKEVA